MLVIVLLVLILLFIGIISNYYINDIRWYCNKVVPFLPNGKSIVAPTVRGDPRTGGLKGIAKP